MRHLSSVNGGHVWDMIRLNGDSTEKHATNTAVCRVRSKTLDVCNVSHKQLHCETPTLKE